MDYKSIVSIMETKQDSMIHQFQSGTLSRIEKNSRFAFTELVCHVKPSPESLQWGSLRWRRGLDILIFDKNSTIYIVSNFNLGEAWSFIWGD